MDGSTLTVLATSREPLVVDGEQVVGLAPLAEPAAVELFLERLDTPPSDAALASVREIVTAVDGLRDTADAELVRRYLADVVRVIGPAAARSLQGAGC